jgi:hypothetical protein
MTQHKHVSSRSIPRQLLETLLRFVNSDVPEFRAAIEERQDKRDRDLTEALDDLDRDFRKALKERDQDRVKALSDLIKKAKKEPPNRSAARDVEGFPYFKLPYPAFWGPEEEAELRKVATGVLEAIARDDSGLNAFEATVNLHGGIRCTLFSPPGCTGRTRTTNGRVLRGQREGPAILVPYAQNPKDLAYAIIGIARCTPTPQGDALADRVSRCVECRKFFLLPTRKCSRFCSEPCRWKVTNREKIEAGKFREYYARRTKRRKVKARRVTR